MKKRLYIAEFSRPDYDNESIWFVGLTNLTYEQQEELAYQTIKSDMYDDDCTLKELKQGVTVEGVYTIPQELITEVYESGSYNIKKDLKKQIKNWKLRIDKLILNPDDQEALKELEAVSNEMMAINV